MERGINWALAMLLSRSVVLSLIWIPMGHDCLAAGPDSKTDFYENRIRPVLSERCFGCHSETFAKSNGGLKLDSLEQVLGGGDNGPSLVVGDANKSLMMLAIRRNDDAVSAMPPEGEPLTPQQVSDFETWINDGAVYPTSKALALDPKQHWSFQPVRMVAVPEIENAESPIDRFLMASWQSAGVVCADEASPEAVARRLAFAITGLPPCPADLLSVRRAGVSFLPNYVDALFSSPQYGEHWARHWMDLVRYAESTGHEYDYEIEGAWRYRDHLVRTINDDVPYDTMIREHIAGDLITPRVVDGRNESLLATGWWMLQECATAPVDLPNDEAERLDNQLDVLCKTFNALTVGCARCHDHKFDPIRTREYYGLFGIAAASPSLRMWANEPEMNSNATKIRKLRDEVDRHRASVTTPSPVQTLEAMQVGEAKVLGDFTVKVPQGWQIFGNAESVTQSDMPLRGLQPGAWSGTLSRKLPANLRSPQFILDADYIDVLVAGQDATVQVVVGNYQMIRGPIYDGLKKLIKSKSYEWKRFNVARWRGRRVHVEVFTGTVEGVHRILHTNDTVQSQFGVRTVLLSNGNPLAVPPAFPLPEQDESEPEIRELMAKLADLEKEIPAPERFIAASELDGIDLPIHARGNANQPKGTTNPRRYLDICTTDQPAASRGSGRLELANAIASHNNPLTARVMVNRVWHHVFGRGLVLTVDNFGMLGDKPSHPELLDWLAYRFVQHHHWQIKPLIRDMVLSRAFRLASGPFPIIDPENKLLSRFPLRRLEAESVRDSILAVSGKLDLAIGGESVLVPHLLSGTGSDSGNNYPPSGPVDGQCRRSLYLASRRSFPSTFLDVFDKPSALTTFGRRDVSNVATQALTLLNDPFVGEQAKAWVASERYEHMPAPKRIEQMFVESIARFPTAEELSMAMQLIDGEEEGWTDLSITLMNLKEFIYVP